MIDKNKIAKAARKCLAAFRKANPDGYSSSIIDIESNCLKNFKDGAKWAINEFLKDLWHQTNKEPEGYDEWILLHYSVGNYYSLAQVKEYKSWKGFVEKMPIDGWLYIDDLFSEEGGNQ